MIVQTFMVLLILSIATIGEGASFSNVYVESEVVPMGYYAYGAPYPSIANPRLSQINSLPSVPGYVAPCVSPCVYPAQAVATVAPVTPSPNVLAYNAKNVPVVVAPPKQEATGYEYSYLVYDENTGDHKAQRELSDGLVVRGEYSFLQPDGYIREVQYVADDISGFNAVVKNFLPVPVEGKRKVEGQKKEESPPCLQTKNESLRERSEEDSGEISIKQLKKIHDILQKEAPGEEFKEKHHNKSKKISNEDPDEESEEKLQKKSKKESKESGEESGEESDSEEFKEELKNKSLKKSSIETEGSKQKNTSKKGSKETSSEESEAEAEKKVSHGKNKEVHGLLKPTDETLVPYKDILRCLEAAMRRNYGVPVAMRQGPSPLSYIVLNKSC